MSFKFEANTNYFVPVSGIQLNNKQKEKLEEVREKMPDVLMQFFIYLKKFFCSIEFKLKGGALLYVLSEGKIPYFDFDFNIVYDEYALRSKPSCLFEENLKSNKIVFQSILLPFIDDYLYYFDINGIHFDVTFACSTKKKILEKPYVNLKNAFFELFQTGTEVEDENNLATDGLKEKKLIFNLQDESLAHVKLLVLFAKLCKTKEQYKISEKDIEAFEESFNTPLDIQQFLKEISRYFISDIREELIFILDHHKLLLAKSLKMTEVQISLFYL